MTGCKCVLWRGQRCHLGKWGSGVNPPPIIYRLFMHNTRRGRSRKVILNGAHTLKHWVHKAQAFKILLMKPAWNRCSGWRIRKVSPWYWAIKKCWPEKKNKKCNANCLPFSGEMGVIVNWKEWQTKRKNKW